MEYSRGFTVGMANQVKTVMLLGLLTALMLGAGQMMGGSFGLAIALGFALVMNLGAYWFSSKIVLAMYHAQKADRTKYRELHEMVEEIAGQAGIPKPEVYIIPTEAANAFATGRSPKNAVVACTSGIMKLLSREELRGVMAHEISHVKNRDVLVTTIAATIAGVISYLAMMAQWTAIFAGFGRDGEEGGNIIGLLAFAIITPLLAAVIKLAISRSREYLADSTGAKTINNSEYLASALEKLESASSRQPLRFGNTSTSGLFIVNPFRGGLAGLLSTHPPMKERVRRLRSMKV